MKQKLTAAKVFDLAEEIAGAEGEGAVTYRRIIAKLGGSPSTLKHILAEWRNERRTRSEVPADLIRMATSIASSLWLSRSEQPQGMDLLCTRTLLLPIGPRRAARFIVSLSLARERQKRSGDWRDGLFREVARILRAAPNPMTGADIWKRLPERQRKEDTADKMPRTLRTIAEAYPDLVQLADGRWSLASLPADRKQPRQNLPKYVGRDTEAARTRAASEMYAELALHILQEACDWVDQEALHRRAMARRPPQTDAERAITARNLGRSLYMLCYRQTIPNLTKDPTGRIFRYGSRGQRRAAD